MCGIFGILDIKTDVSELRTQALELTKLLRHRGPDWSGIWNNDNTILCQIAKLFFRFFNKKV